MAIQMRRGQLANYDKNKMLAGEWGIAIDATTENQKAFIAFAPGVDKEVLFVEDADVVLSEAVKDANGQAKAWARGNSYTANDYASGDGVSTAFTLEEAPASIQLVTIGGQPVSSSDYTVSGNVITFNDAPAAGANNVYVKYTVDTSTENAKYYRDQTEARGAYWEAKTQETGEYWANETQTRGLVMAQQSEAWAIGERGGVPVSTVDNTYHNNSKWYKSLCESVYQQCLSAVQEVNAYLTLIKEFLGVVYINTENLDKLTTEDGDRLIIDY